MTDLVPGARGPAVRQLQNELGRLGHPVAEDGILGRETLAAVQAFVGASVRKRAPEWVLTAITDEAARARERLAPLRRVGAWCGATSLSAPSRDVSFAAEIGITRLDVLVNEHSAARTQRRFTTYDIGKIERLCGAARSRGIEVHLSSWIMPHATYIDRAAEVLVPLCALVKAASLQWDAEEPWTQAIDGLPPAAAATRITERFKALTCPMGVTGIGNTPAGKFRPLAAICDYVVPQAYATSTSGVRPEDAPVRFHRRYTQRFGRPVVIGLAAYRQHGIAGHTPASAIRAALEASASLAGVDTVIFWSLAWIRKSREVATMIASACRR